VKEQAQMYNLDVIGGVSLKVSIFVIVVKAELGTVAGVEDLLKIAASAVVHTCFAELCCLDVIFVSVSFAGTGRFEYIVAGLSKVVDSLVDSMFSLSNSLKIAIDYIQVPVWEHAQSFFSVDLHAVFPPLQWSPKSLLTIGILLINRLPCRGLHNKFSFS
jgi:ABC-type antimicrobial peptide transport system permease subunit